MDEVVLEKISKAFMIDFVNGLYFLFLILRDVLWDLEGERSRIEMMCLNI